MMGPLGRLVSNVVLMLLLLQTATVQGARSRAGRQDISNRASSRGQPGASAASAWSAHVVLDAESGELVVLQGVSNGDAIAEGSYSDADNHKSNFGQLRITTNSGRDDFLQMRAAGYLEGYMTAGRIFDHVYNYKYWFGIQGNGTRDVLQWLREQDLWLQQQLQQRVHAKQQQQQQQDRVSHGNEQRQEQGDQDGAGDEEGFWYAVGLASAQLDGIVQGYNARVSELGPAPDLDHLRRIDFLMINADGDMGDLLSKFITDNDNLTLDLSRLPPAAAWRRLSSSGHCSALVKVQADLSDLFVGHVTWGSYYTMLRIYKHYDFKGLSDPRARGKQLSMSSYPGIVSSVDDFYMVHSTRLVVTETTNDFHNTSLLNFITPQGTLSYQRARAALLLADNGSEWARLISAHSSWTYNNQYMVLDLKRFRPHQELQEGLLTVIELLPGFSESKDMTSRLEAGFWPSFNIPYFKDAYSWAGMPDMVGRLRSKGPQYSSVVSGLSYQLAPRAKIFRRDAGGVDSVHALGRLLRGSSWSNDTYSDGTPWGSLCARGDLDAGGPSVYGCIDGKITSYSMALKAEALVVNGPSSSGGLPPFRWRDTKPYSPGPHRGMPEVYNFEFELQKP